MLHAVKYLMPWMPSHSSHNLFNLKYMPAVVIYAGQFCRKFTHFPSVKFSWLKMCACKKMTNIWYGSEPFALLPNSEERCSRVLRQKRFQWRNELWRPLVTCTRLTCKSVVCTRACVHILRDLLLRKRVGASHCPPMSDISSDISVSYRPR